MAHLPFTAAYYIKGKACHRLGTGIKNYYIAKNTENNIMKKLVTLLVMALFASQAMAQINMKDSTVQVVAYWEKGDKYNYSLKTYDYKITGNDTTWTSRTNSIFSIEVIDSTATGYLLKYTSLDEMGTSPLKGDEDFSKKIEKLASNIPLILKTDEWGYFKGIENFEEYRKQLNQVIDLAFEEVEKLLDAQSKEQKLSKKEKKELKDQTSTMVAKLKTLFNNENYVYKSIEPLTAILTFHGGEFEIRKEYTSESKTPSPFEEGKYLNSHNSYGVYSYNPENSVTTFFLEQVYDNNQLTEATLAMLNKLLPENQKLTELPENQKLEMSILTMVDVHTYTGWPTYGLNVQLTTSQDVKKIKKWEVDIILED